MGFAAVSVTVARLRARQGSEGRKVEGEVVWRKVCEVSGGVGGRVPHVSSLRPEAVVRGGG